MSHSTHQKDGSLDSQHSHTEDSPTVGRTQLLYSPGSSSPLSDTGSHRSQRKAAPSPLQTSTTTSSPGATPTPTRTTFPRGFGDSVSQSLRYSPPGTEVPKSPKERLDDLLASERSFYRPEETSSSDLLSKGIDSRVESSTKPANATLRSVSEPLSPTKSKGGPPGDTRLPMAATAPPHRIDMARGPPRTSSIDSAISSISAAHSHKSSEDNGKNGSSSPDIGNLIQAAGSPEAVIQYLLKEKQSQAAQNTQLWRLVDKQRAMILGLNKDLERSLKDKERYRKKLKESLGHVTGNSTQAVASGASSETSPQGSSSGGTQKGDSSGVPVSAGLRNPQVGDNDQHSPIDVALAPYPVTPPAGITIAKSTPLFNNVNSEHKMPAPSEHAFQQFDADAPASGFESGQQQRKITDIAREVPYNASVPPSRSLPTDPPTRSTGSTLDAKRAPTLTIIEASPNIDQGQPKFPPPPRKPPPAPLNLGKKINTSSHLHQADSADDSDSDYDDVLEVEEIPKSTERGRRKTREEDDREREIAAMKDAELRSLSKKSKSRPTTPKDRTVETANDPLPPNINSRQTVGISPPDARLRHMSPPDSLAGSLAGMMSISGGSDITSQNIVSPPPMSPGLPVSPRPMDRGLSSPLPRNPREASNTSSLASPPMSPRGMGAFPSPMPLSPRAPRQPIPLPPNTPMSLASPGLSRGQHLELASPKPLHIGKKADVSADSLKEASPTSLEPHGIYQGFVTEEYPDLLLPPNALPSIDVRVASSRLKPSRASLMFPNKLEEDPVFTLAIFSRSDRRELWRVEKDLTSLTQLDQQLKKAPTFTAKTPEKSLFSGHAPAKIDARRAALDSYFDEVLNTQMDTQSALDVCGYLSTNTVEPNADESPVSAEESPVRSGPGGRPLRNGYLTKRGKNFGGWKARFFVLDGPVFKYYEAPGGAHLGAIKLQNAQIGKQQQQPDNDSPSRGDPDDVENQYRHAFLILEPKRKDSSSLVRHVLCAESDKERDQWVEALLQYVDYRDSEDEDGTPYHGRNESGSSSHATGANPKKKVYGQGRILNVPETEEGLRAMPYEATAQGEIPHGVKQRLRNNDTPSPPANGYEKDPMLSANTQQAQSKSISAPKNATIIHDSGAWGNKPSSLAPQEDKSKVRKRSFFGFGSKPRGSTDMVEHSNDSTSNLSQMSFDQHGPIRAVFGAPLAEAVRFNHPADVNVELPAVVYRCIEYLDARNAAAEEGIFRLSGSNVVIKQLRERFNVEGDVNLITDDQYYDIHAVASLLKLYLRELPTTILTRELHLDFLAVTEVHELQEKISALNGLVHKLPRANNALLRYLSGFLINIINHSDINKMTVRNVGIVFSPTLNIPAPVFALFLQQYDGIFDSEPDQHTSPVEVTVTAPTLTPDDIRSPRRQHFQELPTPSYDQQSFPRQAPSSFPAPPSFPQVPQHAQQQNNRAIYDTGFAPLQPSYETPLAQPTMAGPEYGHRAPTLAGPAYDQYSGGNVAYRQFSGEQPQTKAKKRESSMFNMGMGLGQRKPSANHLKDDSRLVEDESFFD